MNKHFWLNRLFCAIILFVFGFFIFFNSFFDNKNSFNGINTKTLSTNSSTNKWYETIEESADSENIQLFFNRNATMVFQQSMIATNYILLKNPNAKVVWLVNDSLIENNKWDFQYLLKKYLNINNQTNFMIFSKLSDLNSTVSDDEKYSDVPTEKMLGSLNDFFNTDSKNQFDIWIPDFSLIDVWKNSNQQLRPSNFYKLIQNTNKVNVLTDGNYQTLTFVNDVLKRLNTNANRQFSQNEMEQKFNLYKNDWNLNMYSDFKKYDLFDWVHYEKMFTVFHTKSYTDSPYYKYPDDKVLYKTHDIDYDYLSAANTFFPLSDSSNSLKNAEFIKDYETFFKIQNFNSINDFVWKNIENYDPKKKNVIWMGDSLIREEQYKYPEKQYEINKIVEGYLVQFPPTEYNYFIKHHPSYDYEKQLEVTKYMFGDLIEPIYMKEFPWELFLAWDHKQTLMNTSYQSFFVDEDDQLKSKLIGLQYTTTTIQTTAFYFENTYDYPAEDLNDFVGIKNFPIPMTFDIVNRQIMYELKPNKQYRTNAEKIKKIYDPFIELNVFPNLNEMTSTKDFFHKLNLSIKTDSILFLTKTKILIIYAFVLFFAVIMIAVTICGCLIQLNKKIVVKKPTS